MLISFKKKFVFIHVNKTAGTSFELGTIKDHMGPNCIVTPHTPEEIEIACEQGFARSRPRNYLAKRQMNAKERRYLVRRLFRVSRDPLFSTRFRHHSSINDVKQHLSQENFVEFFKFCFTRNPYDRIVSLISWEIKNAGANKHGPGFVSLDRALVDQFIVSGIIGRAVQSSEGLWSDQNHKQLVDKIFKYENLEESLVEIGNKLNIETPKLAKLKTFANKTVHPKDLFSKEARHYIEKTHHKQMKEFDYCFENSNYYKRQYDNKS